jgi:hypothetical protein
LNRRHFISGAGALLLSTQLSLTSEATDSLHVDRHGLIVQTDGDGGDTAQREGWAWFGSWIRERVLNDPWHVRRSLTFEQAMNFLEIGKTGTFRRHPDQWSDPKDFSRDQTIPIVAALGVWEDYERLNRLWTKTTERHHRAQNGDLIAPDVANLFDRARDIKPEALGDVQLVAGVWARIAQTLRNRDDVGDDLNLIILLLMSKLRFGDRYTASAITAYAKNRPVSYGCFLDSYRQKYGVDLKTGTNEIKRRMDQGIKSGWHTDCPRVLGALRWYFRTESKGNPELAELYSPIVRQWLT